MMHHPKRPIRRDLQLRKQAFRAFRDSLDERDYEKRVALQQTFIRLMNEARKWRRDHYFYNDND